MSTYRLCLEQKKRKLTLFIHKKPFPLPQKKLNIMCQADTEQTHLFLSLLQSDAQTGRIFLLHAFNVQASSLLHYTQNSILKLSFKFN